MYTKYTTLIAVGVLSSAFAHDSTSDVTDRMSHTNVATTTAPPNEVGMVVDGYTLAATTDKKTYLPTDGIYLTAIFKNVSQQSGRVKHSSNPLSVYYISVTLSGGKQVPMTLYGSSMKANSTVNSWNIVTVESNGKMEYVFPLSRMFDMSLSGSYFITVSRSAKKHSDGSGIVVMSNKVDVVIK